MSGHPMRAALTAASLVAGALAAALPAAASGLPEDQLRRAVVGRCLPLFPAFLRADGAVDDAAAARAARAQPGRYTLSATGALGASAPAAGEPPCAVLHPDVPEILARKYVEDVLREWYAGRWVTESRAEGATVYVVPGADATLQITVTADGGAGDAPGSSVAFALR